MPLGAKWKEKTRWVSWRKRTIGVCVFFLFIWPWGQMKRKTHWVSRRKRAIGVCVFFLFIWPQLHKPFLSPFLSQPFLAAATSGNQNYLSHCISALGNLVPWCCCCKDLGSLALESLGPMGAQVIHLVLLLDPLGHWGPSDPLGFGSWIPWAHGGPSDPLGFALESLGPLGPKWSTCSFRSSCQVLFGSVLSYFQESLCSQSVSHCSLKSCSPE